MRRVLVDHAKSRSRIKRNSGARDLPAEETGEVLPPMDFDVVALDDAFEGLQKMEPRLAQVIELHYFGGMTYDQIAAARRHVRRHGAPRHPAGASLAAERNQRRLDPHDSARALAADSVAVRAS